MAEIVAKERLMRGVAKIVAKERELDNPMRSYTSQFTNRSIEQH